VSYHLDHLPGEKPPRLSKADLAFLAMWTVPCALLALGWFLGVR
jgi:hypothetical protein